MKSIRIALLLAAAPILFACATPSTQTLPSAEAAQSDSVAVFATLASIGTFEFEAAPTYTRNVAFRHRSTALARARKISIETFERSIRDADRVRDYLDKAKAADRAHNIAQARQYLNDAIAAINSAEVALSSGVK